MVESKESHTHSHWARHINEWIVISHQRLSLLLLLLSTIETCFIHSSDSFTQSICHWWRLLTTGLFTHIFAISHRPIQTFIRVDEWAWRNANVLCDRLLFEYFPERKIAVFFLSLCLVFMQHALHTATALNDSCKLSSMQTTRKGNQFNQRHTNTSKSNGKRHFVLVNSSTGVSRRVICFLPFNLHARRVDWQTWSMHHDGWSMNGWPEVHEWNQWMNRNSAPSLHRWHVCVVLSLVALWLVRIDVSLLWIHIYYARRAVWSRVLLHLISTQSFLQKCMGRESESLVKESSVIFTQFDPLKLHRFSFLVANWPLLCGSFGFYFSFISELQFSVPFLFRTWKRRHNNRIDADRVRKPQNANKTKRNGQKNVLGIYSSRPEQA